MDRLTFMTTGPVLDTLAGASARIAHLGARDLFLLRSHFEGVALDRLHQRLWRPARGKSLKANS